MAALRLVPATGAAAVDVTGDSALVGRDPTCDVVVSDGSVSRRHARLERRGETWAVVDQGSANGTFVDSQRIVDSPIRSGQEVRFGAMSYRVEIEGEDETGATIITGGMPEATVIQSEPLIAPRPMAPPARPGGVMPPPLPPRIGSPPPPPPPPPRLGGAPPGPPGPPPGGGYSPPSPVPSMAPPPLPPRKGKSPFFWVGIGCCGCLTLVLVFFGLVGGAAFFATRGAVEAVRAQIAEIKSGNMDAAYSRMSNSYRQSHSAADFGAFAARHPGLKENSDSTFTTRNIQNEKAHLEGYLMAASGARETVTYELTREAGEWKIDDIKFDGESAAAAEAASGPGGGLQIETVDLRKEPSGAGVRVDIKVRVTGFSVKPDGEAYRMDLAEDLETIGPGGQRLPALSRVGLHTLRERTTEATGASAQFVNTLNFASAPVPGSYVARLTIRDHVGQNLTTHEVRFDLP